MFSAFGYLKYDPRHKDTKFRDWWCVLTVPNSVLEYYHYWIKKETGKNLNFPAWHGHVSVNRGQKPLKPWFWGKYENERIEFEYDFAYRDDGQYFWVPVYCGRLNEIRLELGLPEYPTPKFHCTLANVKNVTPLKPKIKPKITYPWERNEYFK